LAQSDGLGSSPLLAVIARRLVPADGACGCWVGLVRARRQGGKGGAGIAAIRWIAVTA
jgi:hypothetical protein